MLLPAEISIAGVYVPGLLALAAVLLLIAWALDALAGRTGLYRYAWHPPLLRLAIYVGAFATLGLLLLP
ncbi:DUF1656 domain-containing protein [Xanthomonas hyacinthi]|uniref:DUF1656 domain-containing protein n=1 Tax=Xanthomonas hyacinthi TaxID=56455 RepID=A0A2S7F180_9XANT|nr:DUF1656 domain-containing protein [Xanthomonas hyacinthi]KLD77651.1 hypothetical protein Y886_14465 [Xanthomonas hyacinthi DSM 19077]PPU99175.1 DUF1656 domain-containing protein [Xanthomonas hyacinthi]QGY78151.1 DUF1656 domain-containing protein [Xanthomonas hyacinthi]